METGIDGCRLLAGTGVPTGIVFCGLPAVIRVLDCSGLPARIWVPTAFDGCINYQPASGCG